LIPSPLRLLRLPPVLLAFLIAACSSHPPAPIIDRSTGPARQEIPVDGPYRVRKGDSLDAIAFKYGLDYREIAGWNAIDSPYVIYPDQVIRLKPPPRTASSTSKTQPVPPRKAETRPAPSSPQSMGGTAGVATANPSRWIWPTSGRTLRSFKEGDPARNGLDIAGKEGQDVKATASGQVVYSGNGLIGYGELVIIKHSEQMLSAYAHNRRRMVSEGDVVSQGEKIAELGRNGRNEQVLHFEIRRNGKPVDPLKYLPKQ